MFLNVEEEEEEVVEVEKESSAWKWVAAEGWSSMDLLNCLMCL